MNEYTLGTVLFVYFCKANHPEQQLFICSRSWPLGAELRGAHPVLHAVLAGAAPGGPDDPRGLPQTYGTSTRGLLGLSFQPVSRNSFTWWLRTPTE